ncbi:hypothetical protein E2C01_087625 [Portunus trituberculatus]|uniref:Uncharacterized protein n=1 Tax=Portunus trituberculatus TaxID=210409 RepID=A0A5B7J3V9_PORTR|nr:hypothetical protein [Portunus trituberculatus]
MHGGAGTHALRILCIEEISISCLEILEKVLQPLTANIACMPLGPGRWEVCEMDRRINLEFLIAIVLLGEEIEKESIMPENA